MTVVSGDRPPGPRSIPAAGAAAQARSAEVADLRHAWPPHRPDDTRRNDGPVHCASDSGADRVRRRLRGSPAVVAADRPTGYRSPQLALWPPPSLRKSPDAARQGEPRSGERGTRKSWAATGALSPARPNLPAARTAA